MDKIILATKNIYDDAPITELVDLHDMLIGLHQDDKLLINEAGYIVHQGPKHTWFFARVDPDDALEAYDLINK